MKALHLIVLKAITAATCFLVVATSTLSAANEPVVVSARDFIGSFSTSNKTERVAANKQRSFIISSAKAASVFQKASSLVLTDFPVTPSSDAVVELERSRPIIDGETVFMKNGRPVDESFTPPVVHTYRGKIRGEEHSKVVISMIDGTMIASVESENGERFVISPLNEDKKEAREYVLFNENGVSISPEELGFNCQTSDTPFEHQDNHTSDKHTSRERTLSTELLEFRLAVETDSSLFARFGKDYNRMRTYVLSLIAMVSSIYEDEINVTFIITHFGYWEEGDPYAAGGDISVMLDRLGQYWRNNMGGVDRTIAHLITGPGSTAVGGIAQLDRLCSKGGGYSVSGIHANYTYPTTSYSWDVNVIAHELGHNFGSPHTHICWGNFWGPQPLDTCVTLNQSSSAFAGDACFSTPAIKSQGSIMSYCHLLNGKVELTFTPPVIAVIRQGAEDATCMKTPAEPTIVIQNPLGNQLLAIGTNIDIRWTSARVTMVGIEYSADGGQSWNDIVESIPATTRQYTWTLPNVTSSQMLVRVYDTGTPSVSDTSTVVFEVRSPAITLSRPVGSERFAQQTEVNVSWSKILVESVAVDFSTDNGANWETQATGITALDYKWRVPEVVTSEGIIRIRDEKNNEIISQSQVFSIGVPHLTITAPAAGTQWIVGSQQQIRWESDFIEKVRIEYKTENIGWTRIAILAPATTGSYSWTVPNNLSQQALIRVTTALIENGPVDISGAFIITNVVGVNEPVVAEETFSIVPQPANDFATINFSLTAPVNTVRIAVQDVTGRTVAEVFPEQRTTGSHSIVLPTAQLAQGVYFITIEAGVTTITRTLTVLH